MMTSEALDTLRLAIALYLPEPRPGQRLRFEIADTGRGPRTVHVELLEHGNA